MQQILRSGGETELDALCAIELVLALALSSLLQRRPFLSLSYSLDSMSIFMHHSYTWVILMLRVINAVCGWMVLPGWRSERWLRWTHTRPVHVRPVLL